MSLEIMEAVVKDLLSHRFPESVFCWQGGEPTLMGLDFFERVIEAQMKHGRDGQAVGNAFQTNGTMIDEDWARFLARYQVVVGLSLDGPREIHDGFRRNLAGYGTFERVMEAAELFQKHEVAFNILCVVHRGNQERGREVYRFFRAHGFDYLQFIPCLETDPKTGEVLPFSATPDGLGRFFREVFDEYRRDGFPRVSERNFDALLSLHLSGRPGMCTFDRRCGGYLVIEYNGDVFPCDFFVDRDWRLGNVMEKRLADFFHHPLLKVFAARKQEVPEECRGCGRFSWCYGGCLKDRLPARAAGPGRTYFCAAYQELFAGAEKDMRQWADGIKRREAEIRAVEVARSTKRNDPCPCGSGKKYKKCCGRDV